VVLGLVVLGLVVRGLVVISMVVGDPEGLEGLLLGHVDRGDGVSFRTG